MKISLLLGETAAKLPGNGNVPKLVIEPLLSCKLLKIK